MKANGMYRVRATISPVWPERRGLRAPAVHIAASLRPCHAGAVRGEDRATAAMAGLNKTALP